MLKVLYRISLQCERYVSVSVCVCVCVSKSKLSWVQPPRDGDAYVYLVKNIARSLHRLVA